MGTDRMPAAEVDVSTDLVRRLLADQHPDLAELPLEIMANGWDNLMCRLGTELAVRLPRRAVAAGLLAHEQQWLPVLAPRLPLPVPVPVRIGRPALGYPWSWSVVPLLPGRLAARHPPADPTEAAAVLGGFLGALHVPAPQNAPANPFRGVALVERSESVAIRIRQLTDVIDPGAVTDAWRTATATRPWGGEPLWLHGDLHPANILVDRGRISAVIDFGDVTAGDPATDLAVAWTLLPAECRPAFRGAYDATAGRASDDDMWARARGWALALALAFLAHSSDNRLMAGIGQRTLDAVLTSL